MMIVDIALKVLNDNGPVTADAVCLSKHKMKTAIHNCNSTVAQAGWPCQHPFDAARFYN